MEELYLRQKGGIKQLTDREIRLREIARQRLEEVIEVFGGPRCLGVFLGYPRQTLTNVLAGRSVLKPLDCQMIAGMLGGKYTFEFMRPDLFFTQEEITAAIDGGRLRFDNYADTKRKRIPTLPKSTDQ